MLTFWKFTISPSSLPKTDLELTEDVDEDATVKHWLAVDGGNLKNK
jgi:hypothetical protein